MKITQLAAIAVFSIVSFASNAQNVFPTPNGNVGIGTTSPGQKLTVLIDPLTNGRGIAIQAINFGAAGSQPGLSFLNPFGTLRMNSYLDVSSDTYNIGNALGVPLVCVVQSGNMGISTTTPDAKLAVKGTIHSQEVKVYMLNWSDYAFKPTYKLRSLSEVKTYIDQNQHLPDIPSEQDVIKNGVNLGEMNKVLLKKVEELTLYLIEEHTENKGATPGQSVTAI